MSDSISRKGAIELIKDQAGCNSCHSYDGVRCRACTYEDVMDLIDCMPDSYDWIPVSERLPGVGEKVICQCREKIIKLLKLDSDGDWQEDAEHIYMNGFVIAWMPLPPVYQGEES